MAIYLIRHGETPGNRRRVVQVPETPLSEDGEDQARRLAERLADAGLARIVSSDLRRAAMTAGALEATTGLAVEHDPLLAERNFGDVRGTAYADLDFDLFAPGYAPPAGETWEAFHARVDVAWAGVLTRARETEGHLAVVTHGLVCHSIARRLATLPPDVGAGDEEAPLAFGNTALTILELEPPHRISLFGCTAHLDGPTRGLSGL